MGQTMWTPGFLAQGLKVRGSAGDGVRGTQFLAGKGQWRMQELELGNNMIGRRIMNMGCI